MNTESNWNDIKSKIKEKWNKLSDSEIDSFKNNMDSLSSKIQHVYGVAKDKAEKEYLEFKESIKSYIKEK